MSYTQVTVAGYNSSPPPDDGTSTSGNAVKWITIKQKLFDPLNLAFSSIDSHAASAFATADTALAAHQSGVSTASSNVTALQTTLNAPASTAMLFKQTSAPTGWTKGTDLNDYALRLVTGTPSTAGTTGFSDVLKARTIALANLPSHAHNFSKTATAITFPATTFNYNLSGSSHSAGGGSFRDLLNDNLSESAATLTGTVDISGTSGSSGSGGTWNFAVRYVDLIYATKT